MRRWPNIFALLTLALFALPATLLLLVEGEQPGMLIPSAQADTPHADVGGCGCDSGSSGSSGSCCAE